MLILTLFGLSLLCMPKGLKLSLLYLLQRLKLLLPRSDIPPQALNPDIEVIFHGCELLILLSLHLY